MGKSTTKECPNVFIQTGVSEYDNAFRQINVGELYQRYCNDNGIQFDVVSSIRPYDDTTLFCPAGMQQFKPKFKDPSYTGTVCNIQSCLRLNDMDSIGDGTHLGYFNMMGTFSFRQWSVPQTIDFWMKFLTQNLGLKIDYTTVHPDKDEWKSFYTGEVRHDEGCKWSDGEIGGYCTEFYVNGIEIGNIVNPLGDCIDVGFGLERLDLIVNNTTPKSVDEVLGETIIKIIESGYTPSHYKQGYVLKRLLRTLYKRGGSIDHPLFKKEVERQQRMMDNYRKLVKKNPNKPKEWWYSTHGIELED